MGEEAVEKNEKIPTEMAFYFSKDWVTKAYGQAALKKEKITKGGPQEK